MYEHGNMSNDRRSRERVVARVPVRVRNGPGNPDLSAQTRDVSNNGIFLYTESRMTEGSDVELVLILPPELTSGEKCWVCCHARILRVEQGPGKDFGVAAEIRRMDILPEIPMAK
jgi:PilZ domain